MLLLATVGALSVEAFAPFRLDVPGLRANGAQRRENVLVFNGPNRASTPEAPPWLGPVRDGAAFTISLTATAERRSQPFVARLLTISRDYRHADLVVAQYEGDLLVRVRRRGSDDSGEPPLRVPAVFASAMPRRIVIERDGETIDVSVDGRAAGRLRLGATGLSSWRTEYRLALGDEHLGSRSWDGTLAEATVDMGGRRWDYVSGGLRIPRRFWYVPERVRDWAAPATVGDVRILATHGLLFSSVGALLMLADHRRRWRRAIILSLAIDVALVAGKVCFDGRHPSAFDVMAQFAGAVIGVLAYLAITPKLSKMAPLPSNP